MDINNFHIPEAPPSHDAMRFYGLVVEDEEILGQDGKPARYLVVDLIGADWFNNNLSALGPGLRSETWRTALRTAPVAVLEINTRRHPAARQLLKGTGLAATIWREFVLTYDRAGGAELYRNMFGPAQRVGVALKAIPADLIKDLQKSGALGSYEKSTK